MATPGSSKWPSKWPGDGGRLRLSRRALLGGVASVLARAQKPEISSFDFSLLDEAAVPAELFFVREHFPAPNVSAAGWKLSIAGAVGQPVELTYDGLSALPTRTLPVVLECAENPAGGGLVSQADWGGIALAALLEKSRPAAEAGFLRLTGADGFARTIPLAKAVHPDTLVALAMNGEKMPVNHGFPLRAIIPGWYGMDSVKWLTRLDLLREDEASREYVRLNRSLLAGVQSAGRVTEMNVKSAFSRPVDGALLGGRRFLVRGAAWAGVQRVLRVEISTDGTRSWQPARLLADSRPYAWIQWTFDWRIPGAGRYELAVRATDDLGRTQPAARDAARADNYEWNAWQTVHVTVV